MTIDARKNKKGIIYQLRAKNATSDKIDYKLSNSQKIPIDARKNKKGIALIDHAQKFLFLKPWARKLRRPNFISKECGLNFM